MPSKYLQLGTTGYPEEATFTDTSSGAADANNIAKNAVGFVLASAAINAPVTVYFEGTITGLAGLTVGAMYFLSDTATGGVTLTVPTVAGRIAQRIGFAISTTEINFEAGEPIKRA